jgi:hypothetical protein
VKQAQGIFDPHTIMTRNVVHAMFQKENRSLEELRFEHFSEKGIVASGVPTAVGDTAAAVV